ncbi:alpha carbonic anhydrase 8-like [Sarcophilus harrisii]|uniref:alpha carbonic anhydrase 8-like n=1 Tax=Sarcophilus harrisii TaxID=9305 RepID=UPI001301A570|nr:alpha carbonic anhydrase 8-like [Sarcophilus harrisii]
MMKALNFISSKLRSAFTYDEWRASSWGYEAHRPVLNSDTWARWAPEWPGETSSPSPHQRQKRFEAVQPFLEPCPTPTFPPTPLPAPRSPLPAARSPLPAPYRVRLPVRTVRPNPAFSSAPSSPPPPNLNPRTDKLGETRPETDSETDRSSNSERLFIFISLMGGALLLPPPRPRPL